MYDYDHNDPELEIGPGQNNSYLDWDVSDALGGIARFFFFLAFIGWVMRVIGRAMGAEDTNTRTQRRLPEPRSDEEMLRRFGIHRD